MSYVETEVTVKELKELFFSKEYEVEIDTPDGYQTITAWFDKGLISMVQVQTVNHTTRCAVNHMIQRSDNSWAMADELVIGDAVITETGIETVIAIMGLEPELCYDFTVDHPNHRYWGDGFSSHNSGKSYICSGNIVRDAQKQGIFVILVDTENALDESWLHALGVDTDESKLLKLNMAMIDDVAKTISTFMKDYKDLAQADRPKVLFVIDSLGMLMTPTEVNQFDAGDMKGDMGRKAKALKALVTNCVNMFGSYNVGLVATNHTYASQDPYSPDPNISGGSGFVYASSIVVAMKKLKLKEDEDGNKTTTVNGIRAGCKIMKTRYAKPFEDIEIRIPYETGLNPISGLFDLFEKKGFLTKQGNRYAYIDLNGIEHKYYRKEWNRNENGIMDLVMNEFHEKISKITIANDIESNDDENV